MLALVRALMVSLEPRYLASPLFIGQLLQALQTHLLATYGTTAPGRSRLGGLSLQHEARAKAYLARQPLQHLSVEAVAALCGLSRSHFSKAFKISTGQSPHQWVMHHRLQQVMTQLRSDKPLADVARACGFTDPSHLSRTFRREMGVSPNAWRRRQL
ncbi:MAG: AraC family transcriptional regulator [Rhodoferax sp.]|uniref:helix-turn-helix transcriptional regulator n=1 Tax=Rhodoferax sp. TaxID=50421 RepID=UPI00326699EA